jgi:tRNA dimethylallyltransferase
MRLPKLVVIVGETASGKTALAVELAQKFGGEIICADSATVRRQADIGSAKPTLEEQRLVPHHLLDVVEPDEAFSAAQFKELAQQAIDEIAGRRKLPILVGGTGLYVYSILYDYEFRPAGDTSLRTELNELSALELVQRIQNTGIELGDVDQHNKHRLIRLIETNGEQASKKAMRQNTLALGLQTEREVLRERVTARVEAMLAAGLENEVRSLVERYGWGCEALKGVGYAQWRGYFEGEDLLDETRAKIIKANMDLAKRQRTWFKRNKSIQWISTPVNRTHVDELVTTFLHH